MPNPEQPADGTWWRSRQKSLVVFVHVTATHAITPGDQFVIYVEQVSELVMSKPKAFPLKLWYSRFTPLPPELIPAPVESSGG